MLLCVVPPRNLTRNEFSRLCNCFTRIRSCFSQVTTFLSVNNFDVLNYSYKHCCRSITLEKTAILTPNFCKFIRVIAPKQIQRITSVLGLTQLLRKQQGCLIKKMPHSDQCSRPSIHISCYNAVFELLSDFQHIRHCSVRANLRYFPHGWSVSLR